MGTTELYNVLSVRTQLVGADFPIVRRAGLPRPMIQFDNATTTLALAVVQATV